MAVERSSPGAPDGRRLARRRTALLGEAARVAEYLDALLKRAEYALPPLDEVLRSITDREQRELLRAHGRVESRKRFKGGSSTPLHDGRMVNLLFVDESGQANRGEQPLFALGAVAMMEEATVRYVAEADRIKQEFLSTTAVTFHEPHMRRHETTFRFEGDVGKQRDFCSAVDSLVANADFVAFGVAVRKSEFRALLTSTGDPYLPWDVYVAAIHLLLERYVDYLAKGVETALGRVTFESQGPLEDALHQQAYSELLIAGTQWVPDSVFRNCLETGARFVPKSGSHGTELADMFSRDLFEWVRGGCAAATGGSRWETFSGKIYRRDDMAMGKFGVKVFPDSDIRERIEAHRTA